VVIGRRRAGVAIGVMVLAAACHTAPPPEAPKIAWKQLRGLDYKTNRMPDNVKRLDGTVVQIAGYMVARHEDSGFQMKEHDRDRASKGNGRSG